MAQTDGIVIRVVAGGNLQGAGTKFTIHVRIGNHRYFPIEHWHYHFASDKMNVARILRVDGHGCIRQNGFRTGGCHRNIFIRIVSQRIFKIIQDPGFL